MQAGLLEAQARTVILEEITRAVKELQGAAVAKQGEVDELQVQLRAGRMQIDELKEVRTIFFILDWPRERWL